MPIALAAVVFFMGSLFVRDTAYIVLKQKQDKVAMVNVSSLDMVYDVATTHINVNEK